MRVHTTSQNPLTCHISASSLTYQLPNGRRLLQNLELQLAALRYGLVGQNGAGKTTLAHLLAGRLEPTSGRIVRQGRVALLPQERGPVRVLERSSPNAGHESEPSVAEVLGVGTCLNALRQLDDAPDPALLAELLAQVDDRWELEQTLSDVLAQVGLSGLDPQHPFSSLSGGEQTRARLAGCLLERPDFLILDEPSNHLDAEARRALSFFLERWEGGLLLISHDRTLLCEVDAMLELSEQGLKVYGGGWLEYQEQRRTEQAAQAQALQSAEQLLRVQQRIAQDALERQARRTGRGQRLREKGGMPRIALNTLKGWSERTSSRLQRLQEARVDAAQRTLSELKARVAHERDLHMDLRAPPLSAQRLVLTLDHVWFAYAQEDWVLRDFSLTLQGPERVALEGRNGSGKSTLLRLIEGSLQPTRGTLNRHGIAVAALSQLGEALDPSLTVEMQLRRVAAGLDETQRRLRLGRFFFRGERASVRVGDLSGGERLRLGLACVFSADPPPQLLLLDEPSNSLDLESLEALEAALHGYRGAVLVASHDPFFLERVQVTRVISLEDDALEG